MKYQIGTRVEIVTSEIIGTIVGYDVDENQYMMHWYNTDGTLFNRNNWSEKGLDKRATVLSYQIQLDEELFDEI